MTSKLVSMSVIMALVPVVLVAVAGTASAAEEIGAEDVAAESVSYGLAGPVGIAAVVLGIGGLVTGLLRHRRRVTATAAAVAAAITGPQPAVEQAGGEQVA
jgi:uncharacterized membrane protein